MGSAGIGSRRRWRTSATPWSDLSPNVHLVRLSREAASILGQAQIGMLALRAARLPLVNPAAYSFAAGSIWRTTSRDAAKNLMARRDPRAAFFVGGGSSAVLMRGTLEVFAPLSLSNPWRAALNGPGPYLGRAGDALPD